MFPRWMYHATETARIVASEGELAALGDGWKESPADFGIETCPAVEPAGVEAPVEQEIHVPEVEVPQNPEPALGEEPN